MIRSFRNKRLEKFFINGNRKGIKPEHTSKLSRILDRLDSALNPQDMNLPGYRLHELKGNQKGTWSVWVSGNWRVTFRFDRTDAIDVDYIDYH